MIVIWLLLIIVIIILITRSGSSKGTDLTWRDNQRDTMWREYIASFKQAAKTKGEKRLIDTMIAGDSVEAIIGPITKGEVSDGQSSFQTTTSVAAINYQSPQIAQGEVTLAEPKQPMDGTLLLLYFGAFLFVASAGLFVAFAGLNGAMRTLMVILTMAVMYGGGFWLYGKKGRLQPAGIS